MSIGAPYAKIMTRSGYLAGIELTNGGIKYFENDEGTTYPASEITKFIVALKQHEPENEFVVVPVAGE